MNSPQATSGTVDNFREGVTVGDTAGDDEAGPDHLTRADIDHIAACLESIANLCDALAPLVPLALHAAGMRAAPTGQPPVVNNLVKRR